MSQEAALNARIAEITKGLQALADQRSDTFFQLQESIGDAVLTKRLHEIDAKIATLRAEVTNLEEMRPAAQIQDAAAARAEQRATIDEQIAAIERLGKRRTAAAQKYEAVMASLTPFAQDVRQLNQEIKGIACQVGLSCLGHADFALHGYAVASAAEGVQGLFTADAAAAATARTVAHLTRMRDHLARAHAVADVPADRAAERRATRLQEIQRGTGAPATVAELAAPPIKKD